MFQITQNLRQNGKPSLTPMPLFLAMSVILRDQLAMNSHSSLLNNPCLILKEQFSIKEYWLFNQNVETQIRKRERLGTCGEKKRGKFPSCYFLSGATSCHAEFEFVCDVRCIITNCPGNFFLPAKG